MPCDDCPGGTDWEARATKAEGELRVARVDRAFYDLTVQQRNRAWHEIEALKAEIKTLESVRHK